MALGAIIGGIASGIFGSRGASDAADAQRDAAREQADLARDLYDRGDVLGQDLLNAQMGDIGQAYGSIGQYGQDAYDNAQGRALNLRSGNLNDQSAAYNSIVNRLQRRQGVNADQINAVGDRNLSTLRNARSNSIAGYQPYMDGGAEAQNALRYEMGLSDRPQGYEGMSLSPYAQFRLNEGRREMEGGAAGSGGLYSGNTMKALEDYRQGTATQDRDNQMAQMTGLANRGMSAAGQVAGLRGNYANAITGQRSGTQQALQSNRNAYGDALNSADAQNAAARQGIRGTYYDQRGAADENFANRGINNESARLAAIDNARRARQNQAQGGLATMGGQLQQAYANQGNAAAMGAAMGNQAWGNALNTGIGLYNYNRPQGTYGEGGAYTPPPSFGQQIQNDFQGIGQGWNALRNWGGFGG